MSFRLESLLDAERRKECEKHDAEMGCASYQARFAADEEQPAEADIESSE